MLSNREKQLMDILCSHQNEIVSHKYIVIQMFQGFAEVSVIKDLVCRIRKKTTLKIKTHWKKGYQLITN